MAAIDIVTTGCSRRRTTCARGWGTGACWLAADPAAGGPQFVQPDGSCSPCEGWGWVVDCGGMTCWPYVGWPYVGWPYVGWP